MSVRFFGAQTSLRISRLELEFLLCNHLLRSCSVIMNLFC